MAIFLAAAAAFPLRGRTRFAATVAAGLALFAMLGWLPVWMYLAKKEVLHLGVGSYAALAIAERSLVGAPGMAFALPALGLVPGGCLRRLRSFQNGVACVTVSARECATEFTGTDSDRLV